MHRLMLVLVALAALVPATAPAFEDPPGPPDWAQQQIEQVLAAGLMGPSVDGFRPDDPLTHAELAEALMAVSGDAPTFPDPGLPVSLRELDADLVKLIGLQPVALQIRTAIAAAGLKAPALVGSETVARLLGLRTNHPQELDAIEPEPDGPASRAEAAYSLARVLDLSDAEKQYVANLAASFSLPELTDWQKLVLARALSFVGYPYVWAGTSEKPQAPLGEEVPGGFDCSGFVWRVYKLQPFTGAPTLAEVLRGRTTYEMSGEVGKEERIPLDEIEPGDVLFFGAGPRPKPKQIDHMGIYVGNGWMVHASSEGTTLTPLSDSWVEAFAWARRPLAEAGLV
jgi:cell wall-associated NlpC family hydrolase